MVKELKIANFFRKLQTLPESQKKIILWAIVSVVAIILIIFWFSLAKSRLAGIDLNKSMQSLNPMINNEAGQQQPENNLDNSK